MAISDLPGYIQGYKFTDSAAFYDSTNKYFIDQAGYSDFPASRLEITEGTPSFVDVNSARGMVLDNTCQGFFNLPIKWHGSCIAVWGGPGRMGTNGFILPIIAGANPTSTGNGLIYYQRVGATDYRNYILFPSVTSIAYRGHADDGIYATCFTLDQQSRFVEAMDSGGNITAGSAVADNNVGQVMGSSVEDGIYGSRDRFGNLSGTKGDTSATTNTMIICELHFFSGLLTDAPTTSVETELAALETIYG